MTIRIYHNPACSKSRATLALLENRGLDLEIIEYLKQPPSQATLSQLLEKLGIQARELIRSNEPEFRSSGLSLDSPPAALIELMTRIPKLIQRPIVEVGDKARIGRPPEQVLDIVQ